VAIVIAYVKNLAMPLGASKLGCYLTVVRCPAVRQPPEQIWGDHDSVRRGLRWRVRSFFSRQGHTLSRKSYLYSSIDRVFADRKERKLMPGV